jgi:hypothetical protein
MLHLVTNFKVTNMYNLQHMVNKLSQLQNHQRNNVHHNLSYYFIQLQGHHLT